VSLYETLKISFIYIFQILVGDCFLAKYVHWKIIHIAPAKIQPGAEIGEVTSICMWSVSHVFALLIGPSCFHFHYVFLVTCLFYLFHVLKPFVYSSCIL